MSKNKVATIYNPNLLSKKELIDLFIVRLNKMGKIFKDIKNSTMERPEQHILIEGQRGMGKTTLLLRLAYQVENDPSLNSWLIPLVFNEEQYTVNSLASLWELVAQNLGDKYLIFRDLYAIMDSNYERFEEAEEQYEIYIFNLLVQALQRYDKKLILFIDNFGEMFNKLEGESQRLREVLMTCAEIRVIAASSVVSEAFFEYNEPLYEFFKIEQLKELSLEETKKLLLKLGETYGQEKIKSIVENEPERVETLRRLTGGVIRTIVLLFEIFIDDEKGGAFRDLKNVLDRVTPLYKHRMDDLKSQQQRIVDAIAMNWDAMPVKEIAKKTRIPSKTISAQLKKLEKNGIVQIIETNTKNHLYIIRERFFNIWYLMRNGRKGDTNRVIFLARFLESWLSPKELRNRVERFVDNFENNLIEEEVKGDILLLYQHPSLNIPKYLTKNILLLKGKETQEQPSFLKTHEEIFAHKLRNKNFEFSERAVKKLLFVSAISLEIKGKIIQQFSTLSAADFTGIINALQAAQEKLRAEALQLVEVAQDCEGNYVSMGKLFCDYLGEKEQGLHFYAKAAELDCFSNYELGKKYLEEFDDYNAEKFFIKAHQDDDNLEALEALSQLYEKQFDDLKEARRCVKELLERSDKDKFLYKYALLSCQVEAYKAAKKSWLTCMDRGYRVKYTSYWLGYVYFKLRAYELSEEWCIKTMNLGENDKSPILLAHLYIYHLDRFNEGETLLLNQVKEDNEKAKNSLAWVYYESKQKREYAIKLSREAYEKEDNIYNTHTYATILAWNNNLSESLEVAKGFFTNDKSFKDFSEDIIDYLLLLIAKEAYQQTYELFTATAYKSYQLKDRYKPVYFALMYYMQEEYPNEYLKMGSELKETVAEIIKKIEQKKVDYV